MAENASRRLGRLDFLFNNAGIGVFGLARHHAPQDWGRTLDVNVGGVINGVNAVYPLMRRQGFYGFRTTLSADSRWFANAS